MLMVMLGGIGIGVWERLWSHDEMRAGIRRNELAWQTISERLDKLEAKRAVRTR